MRAVPALLTMEGWGSSAASIQLSKRVGLFMASCSAMRMTGAPISRRELMS